jgi:hypothetical protein
MPLALTVVLVVAGITVLLGLIGFMIDRSAERHERNGGR